MRRRVGGSDRNAGRAPCLSGRAGTRAAVEIAQLTLEVGLQPGTILTLERAQLVDLALEPLAIGLEVADDVAVLLLGLTFDLVGVDAGLQKKLLGVSPGLADCLVGSALGNGKNP